MCTIVCNERINKTHTFCNLTFTRIQYQRLFISQHRSIWILHYRNYVTHKDRRASRWNNGIHSLTLYEDIV